MSETWRRVAGGPYSVSSNGRVRNDRSGHILRPMLHSHGYHRVSLCDGDRRDRYVHHLVLEAFVGAAPEDCQVNHIDGDKTNNRAENLEWVTGSENVRHAVAVGLHKAARGEDHVNAKLSRDQVLDIRRRINSGETVRGTARRYNVDPKSIRDIRDGVNWRHLLQPPEKDYE